MQLLTAEQVEVISGGSITEAVEEFFYDVGYAIGSTAGYIYQNIIIGNGVTDDLASVLSE